jgi:ADP-ribose pyrophosphatase YjhB (NUDIX family)
MFEEPMPHTSHLCYNASLELVKYWFHVGFILPNEELVDEAVREFSKETGLTITVVDLWIILSSVVLRVPLLACKHQVACVYLASVLAHFMNANLRTLTKVEHAVITYSTVRHDDGSYGITTTLSIDGLTLTPHVTALGKESQRKYELLYFSYVAQWQPFRAAALSRQIYDVHRDTALPMQLFF